MNDDLSVTLRPWRNDSNMKLLLAIATPILLLARCNAPELPPAEDLPFEQQGTPEQIQEGNISRWGEQFAKLAATAEGRQDLARIAGNANEVADRRVLAIGALQIAEKGTAGERELLRGLLADKDAESALRRKSICRVHSKRSR